MGIVYHHQQVKQQSPAVGHASPQRLSWEESLAMKHDPVLSRSLQMGFSSQPPKVELTGCAAHSHQHFEQPSALPGAQTGTSWQN